MLQYDCELFFYVETARGSGNATRRVSLPFVPAVGMELSELDREGDPFPWSNTVKRINWLHRQKRFEIDFDHYVDGDDTAEPEVRVREFWGEDWSFERDDGVSRPGPS